MSRRSIVLVVLWMMGALLSFSATALGIRGLSASFNVFEILAMRSLAGLLILVTAAMVRRELRGAIHLNAIGLHAARNLAHFGATYAWTVGVTLLPLATVFALEFTAPAWVGLLAVLFLGERMTAARLVAIVLGFLGVLVILRPGLAALQPASFLVLASAFGFALTAIGTKRLTRTDSTFAILLFMNLIQLPLNLIGADDRFWTKLEPGHALPLAAVCLGGLLSHLCLTNAYRHGDAIMVVPLDFLRIPLIAAVAWALYGEPLDPLVLLGSLVIIGGILWSLRAESRPTRA
jgi:drug/metabolite transporter (DMT)-like permease